MIGKYPRNSFKLIELISHYLPSVLIEKDELSKIILDWNQRPLTKHHKYLALTETSYMIDLYYELKKKLNERLEKGFCIFLNVIKSCKDSQKLDEYYSEVNRECDIINTDSKFNLYLFTLLFSFKLMNQLPKELDELGINKSHVINYPSFQSPCFESSSSFIGQPSDSKDFLQ
jgi:hypothetical protein